uniref:Cyclic nucleotide-binding domain-containing protein n=1 Tax=Biomphalaria glabrata TaxID=6526 RepID=A0A2C9LGG3_BIOGL
MDFIVTRQIQDIIKRCKFLRVNPDEIFIKQGDIGDSMYAILRGTAAVHVMLDCENEKECLNRVELALAKKKLSRNDFGTEVAQTLTGSCIGEVAMVGSNNIRTASCFALNTCDFMVIDRSLYSVSVKEVIEQEFHDKTTFVERNPLFKAWTPRQRNQLVISMKKLKIGYGEKLARQGQDVDNVYFIYKGDIEIQIDSRLYEKQYPQLHSEMKRLLPELTKDTKSLPLAPHLLRKERMTSHRPQKICLLGENETIGSLEIILGLDTYMENATAPGHCELLVLKRGQFEKTFKRKYALATLDQVKESLANKLCLYIYQSDPNKVAFLKFLNIKLMDSNILLEVKRSKHAKARRNTNIGGERVNRSVEQQDIKNVMKRLHMSTNRLVPKDRSRQGNSESQSFQSSLNRKLTCFKHVILFCSLRLLGY